MFRSPLHSRPLQLQPLQRAAGFIFQAANIVSPPNATNEILGMPGIKASREQNPAHNPQRASGFEHLLADVCAERKVRSGSGDDNAARD